MHPIKQYNAVGPVLLAGEQTHHVIAAIKKHNKEVHIRNEGSYIRVLVPNRCYLPRKTIEQEMQGTFTFPDDLEMIMPAFKGNLIFSKDEAIWSFEDNKNQDDNI